MADRSKGKAKKSPSPGSKNLNRGHRIGQKYDHLSKKRTGLDPRLKHLTKATRDGAPAPKVIRQKRTPEAIAAAAAAAEVAGDDAEDADAAASAAEAEPASIEEELDEDEMVHKESIADVGEDWIEKAKRLEREAEEERQRIEMERLREAQRVEAEAARLRFEEEERQFFQKAEEDKQRRMLKREQDKLARQARLQASTFNRGAAENALKALDDIRKDQETQTQAREERFEKTKAHREQRAERRKRVKDLLARTKEAKASGSLVVSKTTEKAILKFSGVQTDALGSVALKLLNFKTKVDNGAGEESISATAAPETKPQSRPQATEL